METNFDKVIERNKLIIIDLLADKGWCISKSSYRIFTDCKTCTNHCKDCIQASNLKKWLKKEYTSGMSQVDVLSYRLKYLNRVRSKNGHTNSC